MTTWPGFIPNTDIDQDSPITQPLMTALRDGPLSIFEGDSSVPDDLKLSIPLGTLNTTSGTTQTLTSLTLTQINRLFLVFNNVSLTASQSVSVAGSAVSAASATTHRGLVYIDLGTGQMVGLLNGVATADTAINTSTTSIAVSCGANFNGGAVIFYGVR